MAFGKKVGSLKTLKEQLKKGGGGAGFIKAIPADDAGNGSLLVRFLEEPDEWVAYREAYDEVRRRYYPVPDEGEAGYPDKDQRVSTRYVANVVIVQEDGEDVEARSVPLKMAKDLVNQLVVRFEKYETICDRDYELFRTGTKLNTTYGLTPESPTKRTVTKFKKADLIEVLQAAYDDVWAEDGDTPPKAAKPKATAAKRVVKEEEPEDGDAGDELPFDLDTLAAQADDDDDTDAQNAIADLAEKHGIDPDDHELWADVVAAIEAAVAEDDPEPEGDDEDVEPAADDEPEDGDDDTYTRAELEDMTIGQLRAVARDNQISTRGLKPSQIVAELMGE